MFCRKCGHKLNDDAKFCPKCGTPISKASLDETEEKQADCKTDIQEKQNEISKAEKISGKKKSDKSKKKHPIVVTFLVFIMLTGILLATDYFKIVDYSPLFDNSNGKPGLPVISFGKSDDNSEDSSSTDVSVPAPIVADEYFEENGTVVAKVDANVSDTIQSGDEAVDDFTDRGFSEIRMMVPYTKDGQYNGAIIDNDGSNENYPVFQSSYISATGILWTIFSINGSVMATPVTYNMESDNNAKTMISEKESLVSYDGQTNYFYETVPDDTVVIVKTVDKITKELLDSLTVEDIDDL